MAELNDIGLEMSDSDERSVHIIENCPSPPMPFHRTSNNPPVIHTQIFAPFDTILFMDAKTYLLQNTSHTSSVPRKQNGNFFSRFLDLFRSSKASSQTLEFNRQCDQLLNLSKHPCDMNDRVHLRILYTIYRRLLNSTASFHATTGTHWEEIGFQGINPETDFRATGLFSLFCLIYFVDSMYLPLAKEIYGLSRHPEQNFPFCCVAINLANLLIQHLRPPSARITLRKSVDDSGGKVLLESAAVELVGKLFVALYLNFYVKWKDNGHTVADTQQVFKELDDLLAHRPKSLMQEFDAFFRRRQEPAETPTAF